MVPAGPAPLTLGLRDHRPVQESPLRSLCQCGLLPRRRPLSAAGGLCQAGRTAGQAVGAAHADGVAGTSSSLVPRRPVVRRVEEDREAHHRHRE